MNLAARIDMLDTFWDFTGIDRAVYLWHFVKELTAGEIALRLNRPIGHIRLRVEDIAAYIEGKFAVASSVLAYAKVKEATAAMDRFSAKLDKRDQSIRTREQALVERQKELSIQISDAKDIRRANDINALKARLDELDRSQRMAWESNARLRQQIIEGRDK